MFEIIFMIFLKLTSLVSYIYDARNRFKISKRSWGKNWPIIFGYLINILPL